MLRFVCGPIYHLEPRYLGAQARQFQPAGSDLLGAGTVKFGNLHGLDSEGSSQRRIDQPELCADTADGVDLGNWGFVNEVLRV